MDEILRNTFIAVLTLSTGIHLWLLKRHINFVSLNKNKVPDAFKKISVSKTIKKQQIMQSKKVNWALMTLLLRPLYCFY